MDLFGILFFAYFVIGTLFIPVYDRFLKPKDKVVPNIQYFYMDILWPIALILIAYNRIFKK